ncbi:hypothetical protein [Limnoglobus roseus]|uniref:Uncharacterized protein n=1 Tax=Limnoglobus roseus TaxID=2598579 RepID=A0A5C1AAJ7_9BACT|nr:hypothetical protein [Limnoglobus roseus]QEL15046.1 hypothetical protein PX52LOC_01952 [Limnoglobus roseus]
MKSLLPFAFLAFLFVPASNGQPPVKDGGPANPREPDPSLWTTKLTISPTPAPKPALKYELLPPARDRSPGNAALGYQRAWVIRPARPKDAKEAQEQNDLLDQWGQLPVEQLSTGKMAAFLQAYDDMLKEVDDAARRGSCDWQTEKLKAQDISRILPSVQGHRELQHILSLKCRMELGEKKFPEAFRTLQTGFQLGKHVGEGSTLIESLVGLSLTAVMIGRAEDWIGRPDAPNLYWSFTTLPRPFINPRPGLDGETRFQELYLPSLKDLERGPVSEEVASNAVANWMKSLAGGTPGELGGLESLAQNVTVAAMMAAQGPGAKKDLLARGLAKKDVDAMPTTQAVLLRNVYGHRDLWDEQVKLFGLPAYQARPEVEKIEQQIKTTKAAAKNDPFLTMMTLIYPAVQKVYFSHARLERRFALIRALEAVRLQIAFDGKVPATLANVTIVPVPDDPFTGKPFEYTAKEGGFTLTAPRLKADQPNAGEHVYEVTVRK